LYSNWGKLLQKGKVRHTRQRKGEGRRIDGGQEKTRVVGRGQGGSVRQSEEAGQRRESFEISGQRWRKGGGPRRAAQHEGDLWIGEGGNV